MKSRTKILLKTTLNIFYVTFFTIIFSFIFVISIHAQIPNSIDGVEIGSDPENPNPGQNVTVSVESYNTDLNSASVVWLVNGKNYAQGTGLKSVSVSAPSLGKNTSIVTIIMTAEGKEVRKSITIKSGSVDLVWESEGYIPPFYKGKAVFAYENLVKITAMPHLSNNESAELDSRTLIYKWKKNDKVVLDQSGYGKQTLIIKEDIPRPIDIELEVTTKNGSQKGVAFITLQPGEPSISFYEEDPLYGVLYNKAIINRISLSNQEINIRAVPYNFTSYAKNSPLTYSWSINNLLQPELSTNQSIILRTRGDTEGSSAISLEVRNTDDILQGARNAIDVLFNKRPIESSVAF